MKPVKAQLSSDSQLWDLLKKGDANAYEEIFKSHYQLLTNYGLKLNRDKEEVKDCLQVLFSRLWERRAHLGPCNSIRSYLLASVRRLILKRLSEKSKLVELDPKKLKFYVELSAETHLIIDQTAKKRIALLQEAIEQLPERQKEALYLKFYGDESFADIATTMDISTRAVYKLIYKALDNLSEQMNTSSSDISSLLSIFF
ncbi:MAG: sigma-70 family RNA polymerase sigma factor [Cyclobacteriaceae bacterium]